VVYRLT